MHVYSVALTKKQSLLDKNKEPCIPRPAGSVRMHPSLTPAMALFDLLFRTAVLAAVSLLSYLVFTYLHSPLKAIPGPFWAKFTDLWRVYSWWTGHTHLNQIELHRKLGTAVRMGPNFVSLSDPNTIKTVYSTKSSWKKVRAQDATFPIPNVT